MPLALWDKNLSVGISVIDEQHKHLLGIMNNLAAEMHAKNGREALGKALANLAEYTQVHFRYEERLIKKVAPERLVQHAQEHQTLIARLNELKTKFDGSTTGMLSIEALQFLRSWLLAHIAGSDRGIFLQSTAKARLRQPAKD